MPWLGSITFKRRDHDRSGGGGWVGYSIGGWKELFWCMIPPQESFSLLKDMGSREKDTYEMAGNMGKVGRRPCQRREDNWIRWMLVGRGDW